MNASVYRRLCRHRRSKHRKSMASVELVADTPLRQPTLTLMAQTLIFTNFTQMMRRSQPEINIQQNTLMFKDVSDLLCSERLQRPIGRCINKSHRRKLLPWTSAPSDLTVKEVHNTRTECGMELNCSSRNAVGELQPTNCATPTRVTNNASCNWVNFIRSVQFNGCEHALILT